MKAQLVVVCMVALLAVGVSALANPSSASAKLESLSQRVFAEVATTDACGAIGGSCKDITVCGATTGSTVVHGKCPGSASNICCVPAGAKATSSSATVTSYGSCTSAGKPGKCQKSTTCTGTTVHGLCPGDSTITCCIGGSAATSSSSSPSASSGKDTRLPVALGGVCTQNGQSGKCQTVSSCTGGIVRGLCAGNGSISCCMTKDAASKAGLPKVRPSSVVRKPYVNPRTAAARAAEAEMRTKFSRFKSRNRRSYKTAAAEVAAYNQFKANRQRLIKLNDKHRKTDNVQPLFQSTSPFADISPDVFRRYFLSARLASTETAFLEVEEQLALEQMDRDAAFDFTAPAGEEVSEEEIEEYQSFVEFEESQGPVAPQNAVNDGTVQVGGEMIVDWRPKSSPVKMQSQCGSCWAHAVVSVLESAAAIAANNEPMVLSPQQIIDCDLDNGQGGCNGGAPTAAFDWLKEHGSTTAASYPYKAVQGACQIENGTGPKVSSWSYGTVDKDETKLLTNLKKYGPMALYVDASNWATYNSGIYPKAACNNTMSAMDHAVVLTGYGVENGINFWLVRNSWDTNWGEQGYIRLEAGANSCGLALYPSYVQV